MGRGCVETKGSVKGCKRWTGRGVKSDTLKKQEADMHLPRTVSLLSLPFAHTVCSSTTPINKFVSLTLCGLLV